MAEFVMKDLIQKRGLSQAFFIESAATSTEEIGNPVHAGTRQKLLQAGISCAGKVARQLIASDAQRYDLFVGMDEANVRNMRRILGLPAHERIHKLLCFAGDSADVADPWYTGDFDATYRDVLRGCSALLDRLATSNLFG